MELHTRIIAVDTRGEWFEFKTEQGFTVSTKHGDVAEATKALLGQPVVIDYIEKPGRINPHTNQPFINRYLNGIEASQTSVAANGPTITTNGNGGETPSDPRGARMGRNNIAAEAVSTLLQMTDGKPETIQKVLDGLAQWSESGQPVFATTVSQDDIPF